MKRHYWLPITTWNLTDILIDESISPLAYYSTRTFGSRALKPASHNNVILHLNSAICLYPDCYDFVPSEGHSVYILINPVTLNKEYLSEGKNGIAYYYRTIHLRRGNFQVYFQNAMDRKLFGSSCKMNLEIKVMSKYSTEYVYADKMFSIFTQMVFSKENIIFPDLSMEVLVNQEQLYLDKVINHIKGALYGFLAQSIGGKSAAVENFVFSLEKLKSKVNGLRTRYAMATEYNRENLIPALEALQELRGAYGKINIKMNIDLEGIEKRLKALDDLHRAKLDASKKLTDTESTPNLKGANMALLQRDLEQKEMKQELLNRKKELNKKLKKNKEAYSPEAINVELELKNIDESIKFIEHNRKLLRREMALKAGYISDKNSASKEMEEAMNDQFFSILNKIDSWLLSKGWSEVQNGQSMVNTSEIEVDVSLLKYLYGVKEWHSNGILPIKGMPKSIIEGLSREEAELLSVIMSVLLVFNHEDFSDISNKRIEEVLSSVVSWLSEASQASDSKHKQLYYLKSFQDYKLGMQENFELPLDLPVTANFIAFLMKPNSSHDLKKYLLNNKIKMQSIAFVFWGAFVGFAAMPKTFTDPLFEKGLEFSDMVDDYIFDNCIAS